MGKVSKLMGLPQLMECPECQTPMEPKRTLKAKLLAAAGGAAALSLTPVPPAAVAVGAMTARGYIYNKNGIYYKCLKCGFTYSEAAVEKELEKRAKEAEQAMLEGRSQRLQEEDDH